MSIQAVSRALAIRDVSSSEKLLLLALANYADEDDRCWPSQKRLADDTCLSIRTVRTLLAGLEARGFLSRKPRERGDGSRASDIIALHFDAQTTGAQIAGGGEMVSGLTTFEPSVEPSVGTYVAALPPKQREPRRSRRCPDSWTLPTEVFASLVGQGFMPGEIERELATFRDHEFKNPLTDWSAAFRNWMRNSRKFNAQPRHHRPPQSRDEDLGNMLAGAMAAFDERNPVLG